MQVSVLQISLWISSLLPSADETSFLRCKSSTMSVICRCVLLKAKYSGSWPKSCPCSHHQALHQHSEWQFQAVVMTLRQRCSPSCSKTSCSAQRAVRYSAKANILSVGLFAHYEPDRRAAEAQKDVTELDFSQVFNSCIEGKSHSCEFF